MNKRKFTVVIPTRERFDTLAMSLKSVTNQDYDNLEIIVSDNFSGDATRQVVEAQGDARIRYINTGRRVSMSENWEFAIGHVTGEWLTIIGDDDALLPGCFDKLNALINETGAKAIRTSVCSFAWPSLVNGRSGKLSVPMRDGWERRDSRRWLEKVLGGRAPYASLPMLYNGGFVDFDVFNRARDRTGRLYCSCAPDVYSAVLLARILPEYVYSREPMAINGASIHSTGTSVYRVGPVSKKESAPIDKFLTETNIPFHPDVPMQASGDYPKSIQALIYESWLQVREVVPGAPGLEPAAQLEVILATAGPHGAQVHEWGKLFSARHGCDFEAIAARAAGYSRNLKFGRLPETILALGDTYMLPEDKCVLRDVYQASVAAAVILQARPSRWGRTVAATKALLQRMRAARNASHGT